LGEHEAFLNAGSPAFWSASAEQIIETYCSLPVSVFRLSVDYQFNREPRLQLRRNVAFALLYCRQPIIL
jgi:hypothetical protein